MPLHLLDGARTVCLLLTLRALPFACLAAVSPRVAAGRKALALALYAALLAALAHLGALADAAWIAGGMAYYLVLGCGMNRLARLLAGRVLTRGAVFVVLSVLCLLLPGMALPGTAQAMFLVVGWELLLSGYSYCVETSRQASPPGLGECLFFLFVNPTVAWTKRGSPLPEAPRATAGVARALLGVALLLLNASFLRPLYRAANEGASGWLPAPLAALGIVGYGVLRFLSEYAMHSGLASLQIGGMRHLGWEVPERYDWPLLARSPMDFWRRWNTYVRVWLEAYVFLPLATAVARRSRRSAAQVVVAFAVLVASGLLHDGYIFAGRLVFSTRVTQVFLAAGLAALVWRLSGGLLDVVRARLPGAWQRGCDAAATVVARVVMAAGLVAAGVLWW